MATYGADSELSQRVGISGTRFGCRWSSGYGWDMMLREYGRLHSLKTRFGLVGTVRQRRQKGAVQQQREKGVAHMVFNL